MAETADLCPNSTIPSKLLKPKKIKNYVRTNWDASQKKMRYFYDWKKYDTVENMGYIRKKCNMLKERRDIVEKNGICKKKYGIKDKEFDWKYTQYMLQ